MREIEGVVLAAGLSSRMGQHKMALPLGDRTVIERSLESMYEIVRRIWVVVGWQAERIRELLAAYAKVELVVNENYRRGMFSSVKVGIARVRAPAFFLLPGDCPFVGSEVYAQMLTVPGNIVIPTCRGKRGHPVLFRSQLIPEILAMPDDGTLRDYIDTSRHATIEVEDEGILLDLDTQGEYDALRAKFQL
jgi:molybdenum cofactor cytidylyltransferase